MSLDRARLALDGLSTGDAFGERFFLPFGNEELALYQIENRGFPRPPWRTTDDTEMATAIVDVLGAVGRIDQDRLARAFALRYRRDPARGYGAGAHDILAAIGRGEPWRDVSRAAFGGAGSLGNGAAMRVAPVGAFFADDMDRVVAEARATAEVTHAHPEGIAGAVAVAVAAARAARGEHDILEEALRRTPPGETAEGLRRALAMPASATVQQAVRELGNGSRVTAGDTVPFALWCARRHLGSFEDAMWTTVAGLGDRDTTCAIAGGVVALAVGRVPDAWLAARESLRPEPHDAE